LAIVLGVLIASAAVEVAPAHALTWDRTTILRSWPIGGCLDSNWAGAVYVIGCNRGAYQNWKIRQVYDPSFNISWEVLADGATGRCLAHNPQGLYTAPCNYWDWYQHWDIHEFIDRFGHDVMNISNLGTGGCLDSNGPGAPPYVNYYCYSGGAQDWKPGF
jgi:hypothetical protein